MHTQPIMETGFVFSLQEDEEGLQYVKVLDPWYNVPETHTKVSDRLVIKLRPYTSYSHALELADFLNRRLKDLPLMEVRGLYEGIVL